MKREFYNVILMRGLPGSGKTTWARDWVKKHASYKRINRDDLRMMLCNGAYNQKAEKVVLWVREDIIINLLEYGYDLVLDEAHLSVERMEESIGLLKKAKTNLPVRYKFKDFTDVPPDVCIERDKRRRGKAHVGPRFINMMWQKHIAGEDPEEEKWITLS